MLQTEQVLSPAELDLASIRAQVLGPSARIYEAMGGGWVTRADQMTPCVPMSAGSEPMRQRWF